MEIHQTYQTAITLRRGLTNWLREMSDLIEPGEKSIRNRPHRNIASSTLARNLERASVEEVHYEKKLTELNKTCELLKNSLEVCFLTFYKCNFSLFIQILGFSRFFLVKSFDDVVNVEFNGATLNFLRGLSPRSDPIPYSSRILEAILVINFLLTFDFLWIS